MRWVDVRWVDVRWIVCGVSWVGLCVV